MIYWTGYRGHEPEIVGKRQKHDNTIYTFDIETTSIIIHNGQVLPAVEYIKLNEKEQANCSFYSNMYIWMFSIDGVVYYGRRWSEFVKFIKLLDSYSPYTKYIHVHNLRI